MTDPFEILGLKPGATDRAIRAAYRRLARLHHPDHNPGSDGTLFRAVESAYRAAIEWNQRQSNHSRVAHQTDSVDPRDRLQSLKLSDLPQAPKAPEKRARAIGWYVGGVVILLLTVLASANQPKAEYAMIWLIAAAACFTVGVVQDRGSQRADRATALAYEDALDKYRDALHHYEAWANVLGTDPRVATIAQQMDNASAQRGVVLAGQNDPRARLRRAWYVAEQIPPSDQIVDVFTAALEGPASPLCTIWVTNTALFVDQIRYEPDFAFWWIEPDCTVRSSDLTVDLLSPSSTIRLSFGRSFDPAGRGRAHADASRVGQLVAQLIAAA